MTDTQADPIPPPDDASIADHAPGRDAEKVRIAAPAPARRRAWVPAAYALGALVLVGAGLYLWRTPDPGTLARATTPAANGDTAPAANEDTAPPANLATRLAALEQRVDQLANRPSAASPDSAAPGSASINLAPINARLAALEQHQASAASAAQPDTADLAARLATADQRTAALTSQVASLGQRSQGEDADIETKLQALSAKVAGNDQLAGQVSGLADRATKLARLQAARAALDAGHPLGTLPNAAPALVRFADTAPPTEAALRLAFPDAAQAALRAAQPHADGQPFLDRIWARMQQTVTVREGDRVIVGNPAAGILARAQSDLDAGDLAGAVAALGSLPPDAAQPLAGWLGQARALLAARAALADLAEHA